MERAIVVFVILILMLLTAFNTLESFSSLQASPSESFPMYDGLYIPDTLTMNCMKGLKNPLPPDEYSIQSRLIPQAAPKWRLGQRYPAMPVQAVIY